MATAKKSFPQSVEAAREKALEAFRTAKEAYNIAEKAKKVAQANLEAALGEDFTEATIKGFKVTWKFDSTIDQDKVRNKRPELWAESLKDPEMDTTKFRTLHPDLVEQFEIASNRRPLKVTLA